MQVARYSVQFVLGIVLPLLVQLWDRRRLTPEESARGWNGASWGAALYAFDEFSLLGWFWVTRRWRGIPRGIAWSLAVFVLLRYAVDRAFLAALGLPNDVEVVELGAAYVGALVVAVVPWSIAFAGERRARRREAAARQRRSSVSAAESMQ